MEFAQPAYASKKEDLELPTATSKAQRIAHAAVGREVPMDEIACELIPGITREEFMELYAIMMTMHDKQHHFKFISISPAQPDLVCEISFHEHVPELIDGQYSGPGTARDGLYNKIPGVGPRFPGIIASVRGIIIGDPNEPHNVELVAQTTKARRARRRTQ